MTDEEIRKEMEKEETICGYCGFDEDECMIGWGCCTACNHLNEWKKKIRQEVRKELIGEIERMAEDWQEPDWIQIRMSTWKMLKKKEEIK